MPVGRRTRKVWKGLWSIHAQTRSPAESTDRDCPQAFHASNEARENPNFDDPKIQLLNRAMNASIRRSE